MKKKEKKNNKKLIVVIALVLLLSVVGITLAYFVGQIGSGATANINVTTATVDTLTFTTGADINIGPVTQQNFASGQPNQSGSTTATAMLRANNTTNTANETYNLYVNITNNTFQKTSNNAELILTITNPAGTVVNSLSGLTYTTVKGVSGFDVTEKSGLITIASDYAINVPNASNNPKTDTWNITLTFVNLDADQSANAGASFQASAIIQKEIYEEPAVYWNNNFQSQEFAIGNTPATTINYENTSNPFIKSTTSQHQACIHYNNNIFCLGPNYWDTDGETTKTKLKTAMESALGTSADNCSSGSIIANCNFGSLDFYVYADGSVFSNLYSIRCQVYNNGSASCFPVD